MARHWRPRATGPAAASRQTKYPAMATEYLQSGLYSQTAPTAPAQACPETSKTRRRWLWTAVGTLQPTTPATIEHMACQVQILTYLLVTIYVLATSAFLDIQALNIAPHLGRVGKAPNPRATGTKRHDPLPPKCGVFSVVTRPRPPSHGSTALLLSNRDVHLG
jgi:hypothetical protein